MALWEYKVITSGKGGFASATMLESYLNQLGKDEWEIVDFRVDTANSLAFNGLVRRSTQREWNLEAAVAAAAKAEADKLRVELMQKQHSGDADASAAALAGTSAADKAAGPDGLRQLRDTERDHDPEALADEASHGADDWSNLDTYEDDLPTFFDAIKPHLRKNPSTPGQSVALNYLAKRWEQAETDLHGALKECGFVLPEAETDAPVYLEFEGDLYWVEKNNRAQFFLNTREKPQPKFRIAHGKPLEPSDPVFVALAEEQSAIEAERTKRAAEQAAREAEVQARRAEREAQRLAAEQARREQQAAAQAAREAAKEAAKQAASAKRETASVAAPITATVVAPGPVTVEVELVSQPAASAAPVVVATGILPQGQALLDVIRPQMRRNRRGPGYSGSSAYLAKFFKVEETMLKAALAELGLEAAASPGGNSETRTIGAYVYWVNQDGNGVLWINGREATPRERADAAKPNSAAPINPQIPAAESSIAVAGTVPEATSNASGFQGSAEIVDQALVTGFVPLEAGAPSTAGEPPIFRAVPRAMPPIPVAENEVQIDTLPSAAKETIPTAKGKVPETVLKPTSRNAGKGAKINAAAAKKPRGKAALAAAEHTGAKQATAEKPVTAPKGTSRPRTKQSASIAIKQNTAAVE